MFSFLGKKEKDNNICSTIKKNNIKFYNFEVIIKSIIIFIGNIIKGKKKVT